MNQRVDMLLNPNTVNQLYSALLHEAFHYHSCIVLIWPK